MGHSSRVLSLALFIAFFAGCGGGGGGAASNPPVPISITSGNAKQVVSETTGAADISVTFGDTGRAIVGIQTIATPHKVRVAQLATEIFLWMRGRNLVTGSAFPAGLTVVLPQQACTVSGTFSGTLTDADNNGLISSGDTFSVTASSCSFEPSTAISGTMSFSNITINGDPAAFGTAWDLAMTVTMSNLQAADASSSSGTLNGELSLTMATTNGLVVTGSVGITSLRSVVDGVSSTISNFTSTYTENANTDAYTITSAGTVNSSALGGSVSFTTQTALSGINISTFVPDAGMMTIIGAGNSRVVLTSVGGGSVQLDVDADGDGQTDSGGVQSGTWTEINAL